MLSETFAVMSPISTLYYLAIEHTSVIESGVEKISVTSADNHSTKNIDPIPSMSCRSLLLS